MNTAITSTSPDPSTAPDASARRARRLGQLGLGALVVGLLGFLLWAGLAPLDEGVPTPASVALDTKRKAVQHQQGGLVREVLVREGDAVQEGQALLRLDDAVTRANYEATRQRYLALRAAEARLLAEQAGQDHVVFSPELSNAAADPLIARHLAAQQQLFASRRAALHADQQGIAASILGQEASLQAFAGMQDSRQAQRQLFQEQLANTRELVRDGYAPRNQQLELERQVADVGANLMDLQGNTARARQGIVELRQRALARQQEWRKETDAQWAEVARDVQSEQGKFQALEQELERTVIRAPANGQVVGLAYQTVGGVVPAGQKLMDIVPQNETLTLEAHLAPHLVDAVRPGLLTDVRFSAFAQAPQLVVQGRVVSVSADLLTEQGPQGPVSYYLTRVQLTPQGLQALGPHRMQPGMAAEVIIRTGERTVLSYMLHPLTRRLAASMKEQ
jgi:protease secretion system membrane fusion protein